MSSVEEIENMYQALHKKMIDEVGSRKAIKGAKNWYEKTFNTDAGIASNRRNQKFQKNYKVADFRPLLEKVKNAPNRLPEYMEEEDDMTNLINLSRIATDRANLETIIKSSLFGLYSLCHDISERYDSNTVVQTLSEAFNWSNPKSYRFLKRCRRLGQLSEIVGDGFILFGFFFTETDLENVKNEIWDNFLNYLKGNKQVTAYLKKVNLNIIYINSNQ
ncbi:hypothetical protein BD770DRAFT_381776 [Pilaira anomala]|nr:hypothetical protein BD770DRAFT_381776 [Pilaira anomala]